MIDQSVPPSLNGTSPIAHLSSDHYHQLRYESAISDEMITEWGFRTVETPQDYRDYEEELDVANRMPDDQLKRLDSNFPCIAIPIHCLGESPPYVLVLRPDHPVKEKKPDGTFRDRKYIWIKGVKPCLNIHPRYAPYLKDRSWTLLITEGSKKAAALASLGEKVIPIDMFGVWNGMPVDVVTGQHELLIDYDGLILFDRDVLIVFDSDVDRNPSVKKAEATLATLLGREGSHVGRGRLPAGPGGKKVGLDDAIKDGLTWELLQAYIKWDRRTDRVTSVADLQLMEFPPTVWAIPRLVPMGTGLLLGPAKIGKTFFALGLGLSISSGGVALGSIPVEQGEVLYLLLEGSLSQFRQRIDRMIEDEKETWPQKMFIKRRWPRLDEGGLDMIREWVGEHPNTRMIVIDTFKHIRPSVARGRNLYDVDYEAVSELTELALELRISILILHHTNKGLYDDFIDKSNSSMGLPAGVNLVMFLKRERFKEEATLDITGHDVEEMELEMTFNAETCSWSLMDEDEGLKGLSPEAKDILNYIVGKADQTVRTGEIADYRKISDPAATQHLKKLEGQGLLRKLGRGQWQARRLTIKSASTGKVTQVISAIDHT
jgi:DNA-binding transcriptional ArsR family regulator